MEFRKREISESERLFEETGHRDLRIGDFGWWHCRACDKNGDDWDDPKDFECVKDGKDERA